MPSKISRRIYSGPTDLRLMQQLAQSVWSKETRFHIGDLAWNISQYANSWPIALWEEGGHLLACGWMPAGNELDLIVDPTKPELIDQVLEWFELGKNGASDRAVTAFEGEAHIVEGLIRNGYRPLSEGAFDLHMSRALDHLPAVDLPAGYSVHPVTGTDVEKRVGVHRAAWSAILLPNPPSSSFSEERYRAVIASWPYERSLDWVIEAPNGTYASCCIAWLDARNRVGELEPVGTDPGYRGLGLAKAVCLAAMTALRSAGADTAIVYPRGDAAYPVPRQIYGKLGFKPYGRTRRYIRSGSGSL